MHGLLRLVRALIVIRSINLRVNRHLISNLALLNARRLLKIFRHNLNRKSRIRHVNIKLKIRRFRHNRRRQKRQLIRNRIIQRVGNRMMILTTILTILNFSSFNVRRNLRGLINPLIRVLLLIKNLHKVISRVISANANITALHRFIRRRQVHSFRIQSRNFQFNISRLIGHTLIPNRGAFQDLLTLSLLRLLQISPNLNSNLLIFSFMFKDLNSRRSLYVRSRAANSSNSLIRFANTRTTRLNTIRLNRNHRRRKIGQRVSTSTRYVNTTSRKRRALLNRLFSRTTMTERRSNVVSTSADTRRSLRGLTRNYNRFSTFSNFYSNLTLFLTKRTDKNRHLHNLRHNILQGISRMGQNFTITRNRFRNFFRQVRHMFMTWQRQSQHINSCVRIQNIIRVQGLINGNIRVTRHNTRRRRLNLQRHRR